jgi:glutamate synthase domain-containing protein 2
MFSKFTIPLFFLGAALVGSIPMIAVALSHAQADHNVMILFSATAFLSALSALSYWKWKPFLGVLFGTAAAGLLASHFLAGSTWLIVGATVLAFLTQAGLHDFMQPKHSLERAFPLLAHFRRFAELIRPEIQQYWIEKDTEGKPATRDERSFVYATSKGEPSDISFGTKRDYHKPGQIHIRNHTFPIPDKVPIKLSPIVLGPNRRQPAVIHGRFGVSDMSFGSLGRNAVESLASGAGRAGVLLSTGEGGLTPYHLNGVNMNVTWPQLIGWACAYAMSFISSNYRREPMPRSGHIGSGQIMVEIGTAKFGFRTQDGEFDYNRYVEVMANEHCVATKIKLAQGAKPGGGGHLPGAKVTPEIAAIRGIPVGKDCISPNTFSEFSDVPTMMAFIAKLQELSGKPVGIKIVIGEEQFINDVAQWMQAHPAEGPDFIHVDGGEGGTGAAPLMLADYAGMSILNAIPLVDNVLRKHGVRDRVVLMSSGKAFTPAQVFIQLCLGSDFVFGARGFMFALGCIQAMRCASGQCPTGVTTHLPWLQRALVPRIKYIRVANYAETMHKHLIQLCRVAGVHDTFELNRSNLLIVGGTFREVDGAIIHAYPSGQAEPRTPPTPATYGLKAPYGDFKPPRCKPSFGLFAVPDPEPAHVEYAQEPAAPSGQPLVQIGVIKHD